MHLDINWATLADVFAVSLGITAVVVVMFSLGLAAWSRTDHNEPASATSKFHSQGEPPSYTSRFRHQKAATATAVLCFASCLAVAAYGIALIVAG
ncbi:hypothetical protein [Streptomyces platensis]|uniref:hypothetical protein n=1 Tax=Streptomyces platensis TaxID=58346 RepID=UPI0037AB3AC3